MHSPSSPASTIRPFADTQLIWYMIPMNDIDEVPAEADDSLTAQEHAAIRAEQIDKLRAAIKQLPAHYQAVVNLYYWENKSYAEIGDIIHKPIGHRQNLVIPRQTTAKGGLQWINLIYKLPS